MMRAGLKPGSIQRKMMGLRLGLKLLCPALVATLRWPKVRQEPLTCPSSFSRAERNFILWACEHMPARDAAIIKLLLFTGARASSVATARLSGLHVSARSGSITYVGKESKTYQVPLNVEAREALRVYLDGRPDVVHDFIFCAERAPFAPISRGVVWATWRPSWLMWTYASPWVSTRGQAKNRWPRLWSGSWAKINDSRVVFAMTVPAQGQTMAAHLQLLW